MKKNNIMDRQAVFLNNLNPESLLDTGDNAVSVYEAYYKEVSHQLGYAEGSMLVAAKKKKDEAPAITDQDDKTFFENFAGLITRQVTQFIQFLKNRAVKKGVNGDSLDTKEKLSAYINTLETEISIFRKDEFYSKSVVLYIFFALLLCLGDILLGDYIAKDILKAAESAPVKGVLLGLFCIALGVMMEVLINSLYNRLKQTAFRAIIVIIPVLTLFMFVAMGVLRAIALLNTTGGLGVVKETYPPWAIITFFIGMCAAAPTALGCVIFIVLKKISLLRELKRKTKLLMESGQIFNAESLLERNKNGYASDLQSAYKQGFQKGQHDEYEKKPEPEPKPEPKPLIEQLKINLRNKVGGSTKMLIIFLLLALLASCGRKRSGSIKQAHDMSCVILQGLTKAEANSALLWEKKRLLQDENAAIIWQDGILNLAALKKPAYSLLSKIAVSKIFAEQQDHMFDSIQSLFNAMYQPAFINDELRWKQRFFQNLAALSIELLPPEGEKRIYYWANWLPVSFLDISDSLLISYAEEETKHFFSEFKMNKQMLDQASLTFYIPEKYKAAGNQTELMRKVRCYLTKVMEMLGGILTDIKTVII